MCFIDNNYHCTYEYCAHCCLILFPKIVTMSELYTPFIEKHERAHGMRERARVTLVHHRRHLLLTCSISAKERLRGTAATSTGWERLMMRSTGTTTSRVTSGGHYWTCVEVRHKVPAYRPLQITTKAPDQRGWISLPLSSAPVSK